MPEEESHVSLNVKGQICPLPVLKVKKIIDTMQSGEVLEVAATDPRAKGDIERFSERLGHELLSTRSENGIFYFYIRKA
jgi:tRNA 2-thiouridine synthesizing protein A